MNGARWSEQDAEFRRLVSNGVRPEEIATKLGRTPAAVTTHACKLGLRWTEPLSDEQIERIGELVEAGMSSAAIAGRLGIKDGQVKHAVRIYGLVGPRSRVSSITQPFDDRIAELSIIGTPTFKIVREVGQPYWRVNARLLTLARRDAVRDHHAGI